MESLKVFVEATFSTFVHIFEDVELSFVESTKEDADIIYEGYQVMHLVSAKAKKYEGTYVEKDLCALLSDAYDFEIEQDKDDNGHNDFAEDIKYLTLREGIEHDDDKYYDDDGYDDDGDEYCPFYGKPITIPKDMPY